MSIDIPEDKNFDDESSLLILRDAIVQHAPIKELQKIIRYIGCYDIFLKS